MTKLITFEPKELLDLIVHYCDGRGLPLDVDLLGVGVSQFLPRWVGLECASSKWMDGREGQGDEQGRLSPLHIRYEGKRIMTFGEKGTPYDWRDGNDTPRRA